VNYPNGEDRELYSAKLAKKKNGIIYTEPITVRHWRDPKLISKWTKVAAAVKKETENLNLSRDMSVKAQAVNVMDRPVKKILYRFPDGMKATNKFFNDDDQGLPPADDCALIKWPLDLPDGQFKTQKTVKDSNGISVSKRPYDNFVPGFFWDMAEEVELPGRTAQAKSIDPNDLAARLAAALDLEGA
jgi:hypothetical protein